MALSNLFPNYGVALNLARAACLTIALCISPFSVFGYSKIGQSYIHADPNNPSAGSLLVDQAIPSPSGNYIAIFHTNGELAVYESAKGATGEGLRWRSGKSGGDSKWMLRLNLWGVLSAYDGSQNTTPYAALWRTAAASPMAANHFLMMQDDGNLVIYRGKPGDYSCPIWGRFGTVRHDVLSDAVFTGRSYLEQHQKNSPVVLPRGELLVSPNGQLYTRIESDGSFSIRYANGNSGWNTGPHGLDAGMQLGITNGVFSISNYVNGKPEGPFWNPGWIAPNSGGPPWVLYLQDDGNLVMYEGSIANLGKALWDSKGNVYAQFHPLSEQTPDGKQPSQSSGTVSARWSIVGSSVVIWASNSGASRRHCSINYTLGYTTFGTEKQETVNTTSEAEPKASDKEIYRWNTSWTELRFISEPRITWTD